MKKWLCVLIFPTGIAQINNVSIIKAKTENEAKELCI